MFVAFDMMQSFRSNSVVKDSAVNEILRTSPSPERLLHVFLLWLPSSAGSEARWPDTGSPGIINRAEAGAMQEGHPEGRRLPDEVGQNKCSLPALGIKLLVTHLFRGPQLTLKNEVLIWIYILILTLPPFTSCHFIPLHCLFSTVILCGLWSLIFIMGIYHISCQAFFYIPLFS